MKKIHVYACMFMALYCMAQTLYYMNISEIRLALMTIAQMMAWIVAYLGWREVSKNG